MFNRMRLALLSLMFIAACCVRAPDPDPVINISVPMSVAHEWSQGEHPPVSYVLERISIDPTRGGSRCLKSQKLVGGSVESYQWTNAGLTFRIRRQMPNPQFPMRWLFDRGRNEVALSHPVLGGNYTEQFYRELMAAPACSMTF